MIEKKNIDRLFQEKFKDFEAAPSDKVWGNIEARLKEKKKRRVIPLWWKLSGVAALLILGILLWNASNNGSQKPPDGVVNSEPVSNENTSPVVNNPEKSAGEDGKEGENNIEPGNETEVNPPLTIPSAPSQLVLEEQEKTSGKEKRDVNRQRQKLLEERFENNKGNRIANAEDKNEESGPKKKSSNDNLTSDPKFADAIASNKNAGNEIVSERSGKVSDAAAQKDNNLEKSDDEDSGKQIADRQSDNSGSFKSSEGIINSHITPDSSKVGDVQVAETSQPKQDTAKTAVPDSMEELLKEKESAVAVTERKIGRWQVSSNVAPIYFSSIANGSPIDPRFKDNKKTYKPSMSYGVGVQYAVSDKFSVRTGINALNLEYNTTGILISQTPEARKLENVKPNMRGQMIQIDNEPFAATMNLGRTISQFSGSLTQSTGYLEVPVEMSYKLLNRKFGVELIGGFSTLFLNKNDVSVASSGMQLSIGEAENLNKMHFSTNVGVGFRYKILKSLQATVEPVFKYQINTFSNDSGDFKPYFFGVYSGLNYRF